MSNKRSPGRSAQQLRARDVREKRQNRNKRLYTPRKTTEQKALHHIKVAAKIARRNQRIAA